MLKAKHFEVMKAVRNGATIWGLREAKLIREVQRYDPELVEIIKLQELEEIEGVEYDGAGRVPYFGAILTEKGKEFLREGNKHARPSDH